jgi:hypothetical protein
MTTVLWLLLVQGILGAFDTLWYHEWRERLPARTPETTPELRLHAVRDVLYAVLFVSLPWVAWEGAWAGVLTIILVGEILITLWDFVVEIRVRASWGGVKAGERVTHAIMGIVYGAMLAHLLPLIIGWWEDPTELSSNRVHLPGLQWAVTAMGIGALLSGLRDFSATLGRACPPAKAGGSTQGRQPLSESKSEGLCE